MRAREGAEAGGVQEEGERISRRLHTERGAPHTELDLTALRSQPKPKTKSQMLNQPCHPGTPPPR